MQMDKSVKLLFSLYDLFHTDIQNGNLAQEVMAGKDYSKYPRWIPVGNANELKENTVYKYAEEGEDLLILKSEGEVLAVKNRCGNTSLPLDGASIANGFLVCPWHGCTYRLADGIMETNRLLILQKYPVTVTDNGEIRIGLNI
jgi:nitrite reductase/ring-hydroxylating ferredoxin subunit